MHRLSPAHFDVGTSHSAPTWSISSILSSIFSPAPSFPTRLARAKGRGRKAFKQNAPIHRPLAPGLFFYHHIAKTGGTSWSDDIVQLGGLRHCVTPHLVGSGSLHKLNVTIPRVVGWQQGRGCGRICAERQCNLFNREDGLASSVLRFSLHNVEPKLILLLRDPVTHVRSMYSHCQAPTGYLRRMKKAEGLFRPIGFAQWLSLFERGNQSGGWSEGTKYCYYNPANYQTHLLVGPADDPAQRATGKRKRASHTNDDNFLPGGRLHVSPPAVRALRTLLMERAFFVGLTEYYAQSLCLLGRKLGLGKLSTTGCATEIKVTHSDYGNKAGSTELSNEVLARVRAITQIDQYAYGLALSRLVLEAGNAETSLWR